MFETLPVGRQQRLDTFRFSAGEVPYPDLTFAAADKFFAVGRKAERMRRRRLDTKKSFELRMCAPVPNSDRRIRTVGGSDELPIRTKGHGIDRNCRFQHAG